MDDAGLARVLKALADARRLRMVQDIAAAGELSCGQVGDRFDLSQPTISHHLKLLVDAQVLIVRRDGSHGFLSVNQALLDQVAAQLTPRPPRPAARRRAPRASR